MDEQLKRRIRFAEMHRQVRMCVGKSQEYMSLCLGVTKKTVSNWEKGISEPSFFQSLEWFRYLNVNPFPYYLQFTFPESLDDDHNVNERFDFICDNLPNDIKKALLFLFLGDHGTSPTAMIQLMLAHLQAPLQMRLVQAMMTANEYELTKELGELNCPDDIMPDMDILNDAIVKARIATLNGESSYTVPETRKG